MAGLTAAQNLTAWGYNVTVLEANSRTGGRLWSNMDFGYPVDLGAEWIYGTDGNPIFAIAQQNNIPLWPPTNYSYVCNQTASERAHD